MKKWAYSRRRPLEFKEEDMITVKLEPQPLKVFRQVHKRLIRKSEGILKKVGYKFQLTQSSTRVV